MNLTRRKATLGLAAIGAAAILPRRAHAAEYVLKFANSNAVDHPLNVRAAQAAAKILEESGGRVEVKMFPNSQLGGDTDVLSQLRSGGVEFFTLSGLILGNFVPVSAIHGVGFAFKDYASVWPAMDGELGNHLRSVIAKSGLHAFEKNWDDGFRHFFSSTKPISTPADLQGFKLRVPASPMFVSLFKSMGAAPVAINWGETYSALQTKVVDGLEQSLINMESSKVYEVQKYGTLVNYTWNGFFLLANRRAWERLPADMRTIVARNLNAAAEKQREDVAQMEAALRTKLQERGMVLSTPDVAPFKEALQKVGYYKEWKEKFGAEAWGLLETYSGRLA
jgi:tripartite ATP-independent transporter DctP family solute receptor